MGNVLVNDAYLYGIADAIREKHGTEKKYLPSEMADAVRAIQSGGEDLMQYGGSLNRFFWKAEFPEGTDLVIDMPKFGVNNSDQSLYYAFADTTKGLRSVKLKCNDNGVARSAVCAFANSCVEIIDLSEFPVTFSGCSQIFNNCRNLKYIYGELDVTNAGLDYFAKFDTLLEEIRFKEGCICNSLTLDTNSALSQNSIQSIINGLKDLSESTSKTLTFHKDVKAKLTEEQIATITSKNWTLA